jgi:hypothetical protein
VTASPRLRIEARAIAEGLGVGTAPQASVDRVAERIARLVDEVAGADRDALLDLLGALERPGPYDESWLGNVLDAGARARRHVDRTRRVGFLADLDPA